MPTKIFLTGATGYIGGDILYAVHKAHPDYEYTLLVRNEDRAKVVKEKYPNVKFVYGNLDASDVIEKAAAEADIVIHTAESADDASSAKAIAKGLAAGHTAEKPGYWLHICGTGLLIWRDIKENRFGQSPHPDEKYDDIADISKITTTIPDDAPHRNIDKIVLGANSSGGGGASVKTAIVSPPTIYGPGRGPGNTRSIQAYDMAKWTLQNGFAPVIETGLTEWDQVHVHDLADLFVKLVDAATSTDASKEEESEIFGEKGYHFAENGAFTWGDVAKWIAEEMVNQGFMREAKVEKTTLEATKAAGLESSATWALNSKSFANRPRKYLGWTPGRPSLKESISEVVASEAARLGIKPQAK